MTNVLMPAGSLGRAFQHTTTSYKYLFFKAILDACGVTEGGPSRREFTLKEVYLRAIAVAWFPTNTFHLSLGSQDRVAHHIQDLKSALQLEPAEIPAAKELIQRLEGLRDDSRIKDIFRQMDSYVRFRFLTPWLTEQLRGVPDGSRNRAILKLVQEEAGLPMDQRKLPYHFKTRNQEECIELQPWFLEYLEANAVLVYDWWRWNFACYLQDRNPLCPGIVHKLERPESRNLTLHRALWKSRIRQQGAVRCLYSGQILEKDFDLDHFIPWSYLLHDKLWNIHPCLPEANRSKSDKLPSLDLYLANFIKAQAAAVQDIPVLTDSRQKREAIKAEYELSPAINLLELAHTDRSGFKDALEQSIVRLWESARQQGYTANWTYSSAS
ncbi:MAG: hypothetical protein KDK25_08805 [Leptospiraceae bacterium]|nr:hypothetical protein [Leptospiraceae bacterium]